VKHGAHNNCSPTPGLTLDTESAYWCFLASFLAQRIGHTRRGGKPEIKLGRCPPSYEPTCSDCMLSSVEGHKRGIRIGSLPERIEEPRMIKDPYAHYEVCDSGKQKN
jgi:hypothetical protein